ncbi:unnamed protein product, partial [Rangifer tarandus platyrhynchus]
DTEYVLRGRASSLHVDEQLDCAGLGGTELQAGLCPAGLSSDGTGRGQTPGDIAFGMKRLGLAEGLRACLPCPALLPTVQPAIGTFLSRKIPEPTLLTGSPGYLCYQTLSGSDPGICAGWEERKGRLGGMDRAIEEVHNRRSELSARYAGQGGPPSAIWKLQTPGRAGGVIQFESEGVSTREQESQSEGGGQHPQHRLEGGQHREQTPPPSAFCSPVASGAPTWGRASRSTAPPIQMLISSRNAFRRCTQDEFMIQAPHVPVKLTHRNEPSQKNLLGCQSAESRPRRSGRGARRRA